MNRCMNCSYYDGDTDLSLGSCLVNPPTMFVVDGEVQSHRAMVFSDDKACRSYNGPVTSDHASALVG